MSLHNPARSCLKEAIMHHPKQKPLTNQSKNLIGKFGKTIFEILLKTWSAL